MDSMVDTRQAVRDPMALELRITFDGTADGLSDHRLSLGAFGPVLQQLLSSIRRTASGIVQGHDPAAGGRLSVEATQIDIELASLEDNCVTPVLNCVLRDPTGQREFWPPQLLQSAVTRLIEDIASEYRDQSGGPAARAYLQTLPTGVLSHRYVVSGAESGVIIDRIFSGDPGLEPKPRDEGTDIRFIKIRGNVLAVGFPPGPTFVSVRSGDKVLKLKTDESRVERALALRGQRVKAAAVLREDGNRLLWILPESSTEATGVEATTSFSQRHWHETLDRLAK